MKVRNPVLKGFNPDPCMIYVDGVFYIATSTFEYSPSVNIYASRDLVNFELVARPLTKDKLNLTGVQYSGGIWAPCLSYSPILKRFYLVYTVVNSWIDNPFKDCNNYLIWSDKIDGEWSSPQYICSGGFDPSLFHDDDGKSYFMYVIWDYRVTTRGGRFAGIFLQEFDTALSKLTGESRRIFGGSTLGKTEGPHIYKHGGYYYLFTAEGGTGWTHAVTVARSKSIWGDYELHPDTHILTSHEKNSLLKKSGHASICCDDRGNWFLAHLCARPLENDRCILGRETAISNLIWKDGWCYTLGNGAPQEYFENFQNDTIVIDNAVIKYNLADTAQWKDFYFLRTPQDDRQIYVKDNCLIMVGKDSILSNIDQNIMVRRQTDHDFCATVKMRYNPSHFLQMAGLIYRYNEKNQYFLYVFYDEKDKVNKLSMLSFDKGESRIAEETDRIAVGENIYLRVVVNKTKGRFYYSHNGIDFSPCFWEFDASILSDDYANGFTGAFVGMACADMLSKSQPAYFEKFEYKRL